jgi:hypothetical protein
MLELGLSGGSVDDDLINAAIASLRDMHQEASRISPDDSQILELFPGMGRRAKAPVRPTRQTKRSRRSRKRRRSSSRSRTKCGIATTLSYRPRRGSIASAIIKLRLLADPDIGIEIGDGGPLQEKQAQAVRQVLAFLETSADGALTPAN